MRSTDPTVTTFRVPVPYEHRRGATLDWLLMAAGLYFSGIAVLNERKDRDGPLDRIQSLLVGTPSAPFDKGYPARRAEARVVWFRVVSDALGSQVYVSAKHADSATRALIRGFCADLARFWGVEVFDAPV